MRADEKRQEMEIIRETLGYAHRFRSKLFVLNIDCAVIEDQFFPILIEDIAALQRAGIRIVLVPGTRDRLDRTLRNYSISQEYYRGLRITTDTSLPFVEMVAFKIANDLMSALVGADVRSIIGNWVRAKGRGIIDGVDYQHTGLVEKIDAQALYGILEAGAIPIFPPIGWNAAGKTYNLAAEELAYEVSVSLRADKLLFVGTPETSGTEGIKLPKTVITDSQGRLNRLTVQEARELVKMNAQSPTDGDEAVNDVLWRLDLARKACEMGVNRVHLVDGLQEGVVMREIFSNTGGGTMVHTSIFESIRPMLSLIHI